MQFEVKILIVFSLVLVTILFFGSGSLSFKDAKLKADQDEASLSLDQLKKLKNTRDKFLQFVRPLCANSASEDSSNFKLVLEIGTAGHVVRQWRDGDSKFVSCFQKAATDHFFFWNAGKPVFVSFEYTHDLQ